MLNGERKVTREATLAEVYKTVENARNVLNVVVLPPEAGDSGIQESDVEDVAEGREEMVEPSGKLEVEEDPDSD